MSSANSAEQLERPTVTESSIAPEVVPFFDEDSNTFSYVVRDPESKACAIIDPVMEFDMASGATDYRGADSIIGYVNQHGLEVEWIIETHVHADHLSAAPYIREHVGGKVAIGKNVLTVQETFAEIFNTGAEFVTDGSQFDHLFSDGDIYAIGNLRGQAIHTPGHTPACMSHYIGDAVFVGDTLFMPDSGTARADFPGGDASTLFQSTQKILSLPGSTRIFLCHDYGNDSRELEYQTTVAAERESNIHVRQGVAESDFVRMREARDATLAVPHLILPSLQVNMRAGHFPPADADGRLFLKLPLNAFK
jgi:glyoxylase-like metal-dependent hydrolase (beta-lactamase superfamily II)